MAAVSEQHLANLKKETLTKTHNDQGLDLFNDNVVYVSQGRVGEPTLQRKRRTSLRLEDGSQSIPYCYDGHCYRPAL